MVILSDVFWLPKTQFGNRLDVIIIWLDIAKKRSDAFWLPKTQFGNRLDASIVRLDIAKKRSDAFWLPKLKKGVMCFGCQKM